MNIDKAVKAQKLTTELDRLSERFKTFNQIDHLIQKFVYTGENLYEDSINIKNDPLLMESINETISNYYKTSILSIKDRINNL